MADGDKKGVTGPKDAKETNDTKEKATKPADKGHGKSSGKTTDKGQGKSSGKSSLGSKRNSDGDKVDPSGDIPKVVKATEPGEDSMLEKILGRLKQIDQKQTKLGHQFENQDARLTGLEDEYNLKHASGSGSQMQNDGKALQPIFPNKARSIGGDWASDSDDEVLGDVASLVDVYDEEEEEKDENDEEDLDEIIGGKVSKGVVPMDHELELFKKRTMLSDEFSDDDWTKYKAKNTLRYWISKPEARDFLGQKVDVDCPDLKYKNKKKTEKELNECQKYLGGVSIAQIRLAGEMKDLIANAGITMGEFANPDIEMADSRQEASQAMENVKETATKMLKTVAAIGKMSTFTYLKLLSMRRNQFIESIDRSKIARDMVKRLKPSTQYLFGDQIKNVCLTLKNGSQLSSQLQKLRHGGGTGAGRGRGSGSGPVQNRGFRGNGRGFRGRGRGFRGNAKKDG